MPYTLMVRWQGDGGPDVTVSRNGEGWQPRTSLGWMFDAHGMVRNIFVEIREDQQQLEHAIALVRLRFIGAFFQILHSREGIGEQPFKAFFGQRRSFTATLESLIGAQERFVEKMIQAKFRAAERRRCRLRAPRTGAMDGYGGFHPTPLILERLLPRDWGESSTEFLRAS
jgi:hypothetical protein